MAEVLANGVRLNVERLTPHGGPEPGAPVAVTLHGTIVDNLATFYLGLANKLAYAGADVVCYDQRGHGRSERTPSGYRIHDAAADLTGLLDALGLADPVHLVGNSYGATVALSYGLACPERVASLVLVEPPFRIEGFGDFSPPTISDVSFGIPEAEARWWLEQNPGRVAARQLAAAQELLKETTLGADLLSEPPFSPVRLRGLSRPVLAVYGSDSELAATGRELARCVPRCTLVILERHTHFVLYEAADYMRELVGWWLFAGGRRAMPRFASTTGAAFSDPEWFTLPILQDRSTGKTAGIRRRPAVSES
jgi:pimeloyl-ACP methyl ester carboxylesterase